MANSDTMGMSKALLCRSVTEGVNIRQANLARAYAKKGTPKGHSRLVCFAVILIVHQAGARGRQGALLVRQKKTGLRGT